MKIRTIISALLLCCVCVGVRAYDFSVTLDGNRLYFNITDKVKKTACVTYGGSVRNKKQPALTGTVKIPAKVKHDNTIYTISEIGPKAFAGESRLAGVVIPDGVRSIRDFAFEGCDSLRNVVLPAGEMELGEGVFFRCPMIETEAVVSAETAATPDRLQDPAYLALCSRIVDLELQVEELQAPQNNQNSLQDAIIDYLQNKKESASEEVVPESDKNNQPQQ